MTENQFLTYQIFTDKTEADEFSELLKKNHIEFLLDDTNANFDPTFANNEINKEYRLKLKKTDFERVDKIQTEISANQIEAIGRDYYLFGFTDQELIELITKSDEWSKFDYLLAQKILKERGKEINEEFLNALRKQRIEELAKPEGNQKVWIIAGYLFSVFGGVLGLFIGWHLFSHKKTLPNGDRVYGYSTADRKQGKNIFICGIIFFIFWFIVKIFIYN